MIKEAIKQYQSSHGFDVWGNQSTAPAVELLPGCVVPVVKTEAA